jgi:hypothetical protein
MSTFAQREEEMMDAFHTLNSACIAADVLDLVCAVHLNKSNQMMYAYVFCI